VGIAPKLVEFASGLLTQQDNQETAGFGRSDFPEGNEREGE
jgi:hypothetical protein